MDPYDVNKKTSFPLCDIMGGNNFWNLTSFMNVLTVTLESHSGILSNSSVTLDYFIVKGNFMEFLSFMFLLSEYLDFTSTISS